MASTFLFVALILTGLTAPQEVFSSFSSTAIWLVVAGFVIGAAITHSGLGARRGALARPHLSKSYAALIGGLTVLGMALGFVMPSSLGRAAVLVPIGTNMPSFAILPSNIPNIILSGVAEQSLGVQFSYADYLLSHYPILGVVKSVFIVGLVLYFFPAQVAVSADAPATANRSSHRQWALLASCW